MAGRKQHYIQQLLLKGFSADYPADPCHVWVYRRGSKPFRPATEGYGAERDFYGNPAASSLDAEITDLENERFNRFINDLREGADHLVPPKDAADFAIHVMARAKNIRSMLEDGIKAIDVYARPLLFNDNVRRRMIESEIRGNPHAFAQKLGTQLRPGLVRKLLSKGNPRLSRHIRDMVLARRAELDNLLETELGKIQETVAAAHRRTLQQRLRDFSGPRADELSSLRWRRMTTALPIVLGDS